MIILSCRNTKDGLNNIEIVNIPFIETLNKFNKNHIEKYNHITSVSISIEEEDTIICLFANVKLKAQYYIGHTNIGINNIYFYSDSVHSIPGLYNIKYKLKKVVNNNSNLKNHPSIIDYYNEAFIYSKGFIEPMVNSNHLNKQDN
jgi:hypothetical protein